MWFTAHDNDRGQDPDSVSHQVTSAAPHPSTGCCLEAGGARASVAMEDGQDTWEAQFPCLAGSTLRGGVGTS